MAANDFQLRRSKRVLRDVQELNTKEAMAQLLEIDDSQLCLQVKNFNNKGRGIIALKHFCRGDFVVEYAGDLVDKGTAVQRENSLDPSQGFFMYYFEHKGKQYW